ncbi:PAS domain-containing protein [Aliiroseovarius sp. PrR006]|uniref:PAS domain-containing protein n=1 Tax=Aliiroseovarius sp. PrR006 TaxID=2706883 RepID=UPI0013D74E64|nr:PAS domain-containing protein [Aliiroseovarius sp. PrR006]NDW52204.1 PAS domain-containing protein [Aliiroseovarius sp. PrR006]
MDKDQTDPIRGQVAGNKEMKIEYLRNGNVVSLLSARQGKTYPAIAQVKAYWHGLRNGRLCPTRQEVDPRGMAGALHEAFILEKIAPGLARIRLAGQHLNDVLNMEVRGMPISVFFEADARNELHRALEALFDMPAQITLYLAAAGGAFRKPVEAQMVMLPLRDEDGQVTRVLGALQVDGALKSGPHRFSIQSVETSAIVVKNDALASMSKPQTAYDEEKAAAARSREALDLRLGANPGLHMGHVYREPVPGGDDTFRSFVEAQRHFDMRTELDQPDAGKSGQQAHLKLVTSN